MLFNIIMPYVVVDSGFVVTSWTMSWRSYFCEEFISSSVLPCYPTVSRVHESMNLVDEEAVLVGSYRVFNQLTVLRIPRHFPPAALPLTSHRNRTPSVSHQVMHMSAKHSTCPRSSWYHTLWVVGTGAALIFIVQTRTTLTVCMYCPSSIQSIAQQWRWTVNANNLGSSLLSILRGCFYSTYLCADGLLTSTKIWI